MPYSLINGRDWNYKSDTLMIWVGTHSSIDDDQLDVITESASS